MPTREACSETPSRPSASPVARAPRAPAAAAEAFAEALAEALAPTTRTGGGGALAGAFAVSSAGVVSHPGRPSLVFSIAVSRAAACSRAASRAAARSFFNISSRFCSRSRAAVFSWSDAPAPCSRR